MRTDDQTGRTLNWLTAVRRYLLLSASGNLVWEIAQLPLYTIWRTGRPGEIAFAVLHCTMGDVAIAGVALAVGLVLLGKPGWPATRRGPVAGCTILVGAGYTIYSEFLNTTVLKTWTYSGLMPVVPGLGVGLAPLAQWLVVPLIALWVVVRRSR